MIKKKKRKRKSKFEKVFKLNLPDHCYDENGNAIFDEVMKIFIHPVN
jgi:hypothetical protein